MIRALATLALCILLVACGKRDAALPFYLTHVEEMRKLPEADLLRMKDNIFTESAKLPDRAVNDPTAENGTTTASGTLHAVGGHGAATGTIELRRQADGATALVLRDFRVVNAPDLQIVLTTEGETVARPLRGNVGTQVESLPADDYPTVAIRSVLFEETVAEAELAPR